MNSGRHRRFPAVDRTIPPSAPVLEDEDEFDELDEIAVDANAEVIDPDDEVDDDGEDGDVEDGEQDDADDGDDPGDYPADGSIPEVLAWVGDDSNRAAQALVIEQYRESPRKGIISALSPDPA